MKKLIIIFLIIDSINIFTQDPVMIELRKKFDNATLSESFLIKAEIFMNKNTEQVSFSAYRSMLLFIKAKYRFNPYFKLNYFNKGKEKLEKAVKLYPNDIETRFIRLAIQTKTPSFLGYNESYKIDKEFILKNYSKLTDTDLKRRIKLFFKENKILTETELKQL